MAIRDLVNPPSDDIYQKAEQIKLDLAILEGIQNTRYLRGRSEVAKSGNLHLAWEFAQKPEDHGRFVNMLRVSPFVFEFILLLIKDHPVFTNNSHNPQAPVDVQLAVTLYRMGRFGNGASLEDIARIAGCSEGAVEKYTDRCFEAIESLHGIFVQRLTEEEKEREKEWIDKTLGFRGLWREGYLMYDGTIVVFYSKPAFNGDAYYTRKSNYGLNVQVNFLSKFISYAFFTFHCFFRSETFLQTCESLITPMVLQDLPMMLLLLSTPVLSRTHNTYFKGKNLLGLTPLTLFPQL
jgi:hypothetical protein